MRANWSHWSLRRTLLTVLIPGLISVMGLELVVSWRNALAAANAAFDRSLLGAIKAMDANISTASGGLSVELPYRMLEFFELTANGQVFYRVASGDALVEIGDAGLPSSPLPLVNGQPQFSDAVYYGAPIRLASYARKLSQPLSLGSNSDRVIIQVAETLQSRQDFTRRMMLEAVARDVLLLAAALTLVVLAVNGALHPLQRLRAEVAARADDDLTPIHAQQVPKDVQALVEALNLHTQRTREVLDARRNFIDDASHQLRTPLTTLATQVAFAQREPDPDQVNIALTAIKNQVDAAIRQTNQMLALARADALELVPEPLDLLQLAEEVARSLWPLARQQGIDLGLEAWPDPQSHAQVSAVGIATLLREALSNLLHNALLHTPKGGHVTVQVGFQTGKTEVWAVLRVLDDGPGMLAADRARVGERFLRVLPVVCPAVGAPAGPSAPQSSGLGLAIAHTIARRHGGHLQLDAAGQDPQRPGLLACLSWPLPQPMSVPGAAPSEPMPGQTLG